MRTTYFAPVLCLLMISCGSDPARSVRILERHAGPVSAASTAPTSVTFSPADASRPVAQLDFCPPAAEGAPGASTFVAKGPCEFEHRGAASCESMRDDFVAVLTRKAQHGGTLVVYLNVEQYRGPGAYEGAQMFIAAQGGSTIFRWSNDQVRATVGPGEAFVSLPSTQLDLEPMLTDCTILIGPLTNHQYQCGGSRQTDIAVHSEEMISGTLQCGSVKKTME